MFTECPQCAQRLRPGWRRCPRCRLVLPQEPLPAGTDTSTEQSGRPRWVVVVSAIVTGALCAGVLIGIGSSAASPEKALAPPTSDIGTSKPDAHEPRPVDPALVATYDAVDSKRSGATAYIQGDFGGALRDFEAAVEASPEDADAQNNLGQVLIRLGRAKDALPHFDEAVRLGPSRWSYRFNRARAYGLLNRWEEAASEYREAARLFPDDHPTLYNLGLSLLRIKQYAEAAAALEQAVRLAPEEHSFLITLGTAYVGAEEPARGREVFERFLKVAPSDREVPRVKALLESMTAAGQ